MRHLIHSFLMLFVFVTIGIAQETEPKKKNLEVDIGGALRFNYNYSSWKPNQKKRGGDFGFEVFKITADVQYGKVGMHLDQRFYAKSSGGIFLKYGWFQYDFNPKHHLKLGLIPAYFGTQQFNSNSWFFQLPFYLGFEDDHDMGLSYSYKHKKIQFDLGFYKNAEELDFSDNNEISDDRYTYDFSGRNREINQGNARLNYTLGKKSTHNLGVSLQFGGIWNIDTEKVGTHYGIGAHYELKAGRWNLKAQYLTYNNQAINAPGESRDVIEMTAYGFPYNTAAKASVYSGGLSYTLPIKKGPISSLQFYNDYAYMDKAVSDWEATQMNVTGILITVKPLYIYVDYALGKHQPWLGPQWADALTTGDPNNSWESRFNVNFGFYY